MKRLAGLSVLVIFVMALSIGALGVVNARAEHESDGFVDTAQRISPVELKARMDKGENIVIFDVRAREARGETKIKGAVTMPLNELQGRVGEIPFGALVAAYCTWRAEATSARAALMLSEMGFQKVYAIKGGLAAMQAAGFPMEPR